MRIMRSRRPPEDEENPYWISFSDLMSALLVVFLLAVVVLVLQLVQKQSELAAQETQAEEQQELLTNQVQQLAHAEDARAEMVQEIADTLHGQGIPIRVSEDRSILSIPTELLGFEAGSYDIRSKHHDVALQIGSTIGNALRTNGARKFIDTVFVEGHTDERPYDGLEGTGNWGLSTFRAISLWRLWDQDLPADAQLETLRRADGTPLFSVSGYGPTRPITDSQETAAQRAQNRRIDIRFTVRGPTAEDLTEILDVAKGQDG